MSCTFWIRRKKANAKKLAEEKAAEQNVEAVEEVETAEQNVEAVEETPNPPKKKPKKVEADE